MLLRLFEKLAGYIFTDIIVQVPAVVNSIPPLGKYLSMCYLQKITEAVELTQRANICIIKFAKNY